MGFDPVTSEFTVSCKFEIYFTEFYTVLCSNRNEFRSNLSAAFLMNQSECFEVVSTNSDITNRFMPLLGLSWSFVNGALVLVLS